MILFLLLNWRWLLPTAAAAALGLMLGISRIELSSERTARAEERQAAAEMAMKAETAAREKDNANAQVARDLDAIRTQADTNIAASRDDFSRRLADSLRARRSSCSNAMPSPAADPGTPANPTPGGDGGLANADLDAGKRLREAVMALQEDVKECVVWAQKVGR